MKAEVLSPFVEATQEVFQKFLDDNTVQRGELSLNKAGKFGVEVAGSIGITGDFRGRVILGMSLITARRLSAQLNEGEISDDYELDDSAVLEMVNMITGRALSLLSKTSYSFNLSIPTIFVGKEIQFTDLKNVIYLVIPLHTKCGEIQLNIAMQEN